MRLLTIFVGVSYCGRGSPESFVFRSFIFEAGIEETDYSIRKPSYSLGMVISRSL